MDRYQQLLSAFEDVSLSGTVLATADLSSTPRALIAAKTGFTIHVQRIEVIVTTDAAKTNTFEDTASTPLPVAFVKSSPGVGLVQFEFGPTGFACTESKGLELKNSGAGVALSYTVQAYRKRTAVSTGNTVGVVAPVALP
jgi:hypothetical protein